MHHKRIIVVGAGPAGMMAAIRAAESRANVVLIDKNPALGRKLLLSGKGRCNLTNACSLEAFLPRFSKSGLFLRDAFKVFFNQELMSFFESRGLALKVERQQRVFPVTDSSASVVSVLRRELSKQRVKVLLNTSVASVRVLQSAVTGVGLSDGSCMSADRVILAVGGVSYSFTGSTRDGWRIAEKLGHTISPPRPGLVPLVTGEAYVGRLEGLTLKNIRLIFSCGPKKIDAGIGELLFTKRGISGPLVLTLSGQVFDLLGRKKEVTAAIDLKPALREETLDERFRREFARAPRKSIKNLMGLLLPQRMIEVVLSRAAIDPKIQGSRITRSQRVALVRLFKNFTLSVAGSEPIEEAMVTRGGVNLKEIDPRTLASRLIKGLYFAGEMIDVDADTGGFNLQAAFSTGYLAGESAGYK